LKILKFPKSTYYNLKTKKIKEKKESKLKSGKPHLGYSFTILGEKVTDEELIKQLKKYQNNIDEVESNYGYRKMKYHLLKTEGLIVNHKKLYRLYKENNLLKKRVKKNKSIKNISQSKLLKESNELWELDIKYIKIDGENRFSYLCSVLDVFDKTIIDYYIGLNCKANDISLLLKNAYETRKINSKNNLTIRTDNGSQFVSKEFEKTCSELGLYHERIPNATPNKNAHIESFHSILEFEFVNKYYFSFYSEVYEKISNFINNYNEKRIHSSLGYRSPKEYVSLIENNLIEPKPVKVS